MRKSGRKVRLIVGSGDDGRGLVGHPHHSHRHCRPCHSYLSYRYDDIITDLSISRKQNSRGAVSQKFLQIDF